MKPRLIDLTPVLQRPIESTAIERKCGMAEASQVLMLWNGCIAAANIGE